MSLQISDFQIASLILRAICHGRYCSFIDLPVDIGSKEVGLSQNGLCVGNPKNIGATTYRIVKGYLDHFEAICGLPGLTDGVQKVQILSAITVFIKEITSGVITDDSLESGVCLRLYQKPFIWLVMKDLICPSYLVQCKNLKIIGFPSPSSETAFIGKNDPNFPEDETEDFIFMNTSIQKKSCACASLLCAAIQGHKEEFSKQAISCSDIIDGLLNSPLSDKFIGMAQMAMDDALVDDFMMFFSSFSGQKNYMDNLVSKNAKSKRFVSKFAQLGGISPDRSSVGSWWYLGLIEQLLEPARGSDWSTYERLLPFLKELNDKIDAEREKKGKDGVNYELLLRIKDPEMDPKDVVTIEKRLWSDRIWQD